jgi:hypothetical protein
MKCALSQTVSIIFYTSRALWVTLSAETSLTNTQFFLGGNSALVSGLKRELFIRGAKLQHIRADIFLAAAAPLS